MYERENNMKNITQNVLLTSAEMQLPEELGLYLQKMRESPAEKPCSRASILPAKPLLVNFYICCKVNLFSAVSSAERAGRY